MELEYLKGKNYIVYENLAKKMGLEAAAFLGYLISVDEENTGIKHPLPGNYFYANANIAMKYGLELAAFLGYLMFVDKTSEHIDNEPWFCQTIEEVKERTGYKKKEQEKLLKKLEKLGAIKTKFLGSPQKRYILINYEKVKELSSNIQKNKKE